jgi:uncharacterized Zn-finger protein
MNTEICEQLFRRINEKKNCKGMNEPHFALFWLYNLELHNLEMSGMDRTEPNPLSEYRWSNLKIVPVDFEKLPQKLSVESLTECLSGMTIIDLPFKCEMCPAGYKTAGQLTKHRNSKHKDETSNIGQCMEMCSDIPCGKVLSSSKTLAKHIKTVHRTCSVCNEVFESHNEKAKHMLIHTFCFECDRNFTFESKLKRHMKQKHGL